MSLRVRIASRATMSSVGQMLSIGHWLPWSDRSVNISDASASTVGIASASQDSEREAATFYFDGGADGSSSGSVPPAERDAFKADFGRELARIGSWAAE